MIGISAPLVPAPVSPSSADQVMSTGWLYQPFLSGVLMGVPVTVGGVASTPLSMAMSTAAVPASMAPRPVGYG